MRRISYRIEDLPDLLLTKLASLIAHLPTVDQCIDRGGQPVWIEDRDLAPRSRGIFAQAMCNHHAQVVQQCKDRSLRIDVGDPVVLAGRFALAQLLEITD